MSAYSSTRTLFAIMLAIILAISGMLVTRAYANDDQSTEVHFETPAVSTVLAFVAEHGEHGPHSENTTGGQDDVSLDDKESHEKNHHGDDEGSQASSSCTDNGGTNGQGGTPSTPAPATIVATKIICQNEADLPNWGTGGAGSITAQTATDWITAHPGCSLTEGWKFQYAQGYTYNPGDAFINMAGDPWMTVGPTNAQGSVSWQVPVMENGSSVISVREVLLSGFLPFTHEATPDNSNSISAEMYCSDDIYNYDNLDYVANPVSGNTYYCVAWNVRQASQLSQCSDSIDNDGDGSIDFPADAGCTSATDNDEHNSENNPPIITLVGENPVTLTIGTVFSDPGATASDPEDGVLTPSVTGSVNINTIGTYTLTYTATDSKGLSVSVTRTVNIVPVGTTFQCSDSIDNDGDGSIDFPADAGCTSATDNDENNAPIITLIGESSISVVIGNAYTDLGATATDTEDGNITSNIVATGTVDTATLGTYTIRYNVSDSKGLAATEVTRTVTVVSTPVNPPSGGGGGGGSVPPKCSNGADDDGDGKADYPQDPGCESSNDNDETDQGATSGGGVGAPGLQIFNERLVMLSSTSAKITWNTNLLADSRVVYGDLSKNPVGSAPMYGYMETTSTSSVATSSHEMVVTNLPGNAVTFFRPVSSNGASTVVGVELVTPVVAGSCTYLEKYLRLGYSNDPVEVTKLQRFLKEYEGFTNLAVTGVFDLATDKAVREFQDKYATDVLTPWGLPGNTGYVYYTTQKKVNEIYCQRAFPLSASQLLEIDAYAQTMRSGNTGSVSVNISNIPTTQPSLSVTPSSGVGSVSKPVSKPVIDLAKIDLSEVAPKTPVTELVPQTGDIASGEQTNESYTGKKGFGLSLRDLFAAVPTVGKKDIERVTTTTIDSAPCGTVLGTTTTLTASIAKALSTERGALWVWLILFALILGLGFIMARRNRQTSLR